jgi:hypothetical protein
MSHKQRAIDERMRTGAKHAGGIWRVMPYRSFNDPKHWRERAEEARTHAQQMTDPEVKRMMLTIAEDYEKLARRAQERLVWEQKSEQPT